LMPLARWPCPRDWTALSAADGGGAAAHSTNGWTPTLVHYDWRPTTSA